MEEDESIPLLGGGTDVVDPLRDHYGPGHGPAVWPMKVLILMSDTGGGHRASAEALTSAFRHVYKDNVVVNMTDLWVEIAGWPFSTYPWWYRLVAKYPLLWLVVYWYGKFPPTRWYQEQIWQVLCHNRVREYIDEHQPDVVVSVHPMVNRLTQNVFRRMRAIDKVPSPMFVTVVTDYGDAHPMWFHRNNDATYLPSEPVRNIARKLGIRESRLRVYGLALREKFWNDKTDKFGKRKKLDLHLDRPAALLMGGGDGMGQIDVIAKAVAKQLSERLGPTGSQLVVICGRNKSALEKLESENWPISVRCLGFVSNVDEWMEACDVLITKAGPGTIAEAFVKGLPVIVSSYLPGQETGNMRFVVNNNLGAYAKTPGKIATTLCDWLSDPELLGGMSHRARTFAMPSASVDIARDVGNLYIRNATSQINKLGLTKEIVEERQDALTRSFAVVIAVILGGFLWYIIITWLLTFF
eukprot:Plantae.Rhodophyta-Purpureofilum_apyrenoidigerum.ctg10631.p1 GENE.Plantae.Rhodophyta-Purpureofilum_apyrenoidigerum.ctg10631~~Plantae.Rhodophyta-Purpureofilum_apyrenoidigerum.ctg10631.p1  ORF type:complete len:468 (+),score=61.04 Plantae.Rhodophyta-Purpureofilum_apyrenoidigerum.ctg10631:107-1510(+)